MLVARGSQSSYGQNKTKRNFVKENARVKFGKYAAQKGFTSGSYTQHHPSKCNHTLNGQPIHLKKDSEVQLVRIKYQESVRDLVVPTTVNIHPAIWPVKEINRLTAKSQLVTIDEKKSELQRKYDEMKYLEEECEKRKAHLKELDKIKANYNSDDEADDAAEKQQILDRARIEQIEGTAEFRRANQLIVSKKCQLTRAAQIAEKNQIQREVRDYNLFLEKSILDDCAKALQLESENALKRRQSKAELAESLKDRVNQKELSEKMAAEKALEMDKAEVHANAVELAMLEEQEKKQRTEQMFKTREDIENFKALRETLQNKALEEERIMELKAQEHMRKKQEEMKKMAEARRLVQEEKRRKAEELLMIQAKLLETRNQQGESNIKRLEEEKEREFRRKAKEDALKRKLLHKDVQDVRAFQLQEIRRKKEMEKEQERVALKQLKEKIDSEEMEEKRKMERNRVEKEQLQNEIINQIKEKERKKQMEEERAKVDYIKEQERQKEQLTSIQSVLNAKLAEMEEAKMPLEDIREIKRKIKSKLVS
ncbi:calponin homology domain-containing protein DDB_G0272472-like [Bradysia coprophila]|uniref:calponin homology domain-containing protein DDB_G0272472-like n=1 Tax=Bradysia coprophila TaxID=38358 RepID=UPI00187D8C6A|nr:calponin homology domain-containing protein DDB_G0272472-like [Bradysia coprophila]